MRAAEEAAVSTHCYSIRVRGHLSPEASQRAELAVSYDADSTLVRLELSRACALGPALSRLQTMGLEILEVIQTRPAEGRKWTDSG